MPEKVTSLNGLKVTLEYGSHSFISHNKDYVKLMNLVVCIQLVVNYPSSLTLVMFYCGNLKNRVRSWVCDALKPW